jgi:hypothetical protein
VATSSDDRYPGADREDQQPARLGTGQVAGGVRLGFDGRADDPGRAVLGTAGDDVPDAGQDPAGLPADRLAGQQQGPLARAERAQQAGEQHRRAGR